MSLLLEATADLSFGLENFLRNKERERALAEATSEREFSEAILQSAPGILYFYDQKGKFLRWNRNLETTSGFSGQEIAHMHPLDFIPEKDRSKIGSRINEVFERGESSIEADFLTKGGQSIPYFFTGRHLTFQGRSCLVGIGLDISKRREAEVTLWNLNQTLEAKVAARTMELKSALVRAEAADKVKSSFLANMSHELRTPLNSILGFTSIMLQGLAGRLNDEQDKQLAMVQASARHLLELINDVLDISKIEAGQLHVEARAFDVSEAIEKVVAIIQPLVDDKQLTLKVVLPPDFPTLMSDRRRTEQILLNLLNNAIKFTETGTVTLEVAAIENFQRTPESLPVPAVRLRVTDTGIGIKPETLPMLFEPFRQLDSSTTRQHEGTGLGLAICQKLANSLGGFVTATSKWQEGSEFTVLLPRSLPATHETPDHSAY